MIRGILEDKNISQRQAAGALGISPAAVNLIINKGQWPRKDARAVRKRFAAYLQSLGASPVQALAAVKTSAAHAATKEENSMLNKQTLSSKAKAAFKITRDPFADAISQSDLYLSPSIRYVRETMYQTARHGGLLAVIGDSGSGKSTLRRDLIARLEDEGRNVIVVEPYVLGMEDNDKLGKTMKALHIAEAILYTVAPAQKCQSSPEARFRQAHRVLKDSRKAGNRHCMIIEEAHSLPFPTLKHLKRFYELEYKMEKLLSIILLGQTELEHKLSNTNAEVREVVQRCEVVKVSPLEDLPGYVAHRCAKAGLDAAALFEDAALALLPQLLSGPAPKNSAEPGESLLFPLAVGNMLVCALNTAAAAGEARVTADIMMAL